MAKDTELRSIFRHSTLEILITRLINLVRKY